MVFAHLEQDLAFECLQVEKLNVDSTQQDEVLSALDRLLREFISKLEANVELIWLLMGIWQYLFGVFTGTIIAFVGG